MRSRLVGALKAPFAYVGSHVRLHGTVNMRIRLAQKTTNKKHLIKLAGDYSTEVKIAVALNRHTPKDILIMLAQDPIFEIISAVGRNANKYPEVIEILADEANAIFGDFGAQSNWLIDRYSNGDE